MSVELWVAVAAVLLAAIALASKALDIVRKKSPRSDPPKKVAAADSSGSYGRPAMYEDLPHGFVKEWEELHGWTKELHKLHDRKDDDGVPVWYVSRSHARSLKQIADSMTQLTELLRQHQDTLRAIHAEVKK